jgi:hypothetical protein
MGVAVVVVGVIVSVLGMGVIKARRAANRLTIV